MERILRRRNSASTHDLGCDGLYLEFCGQERKLESHERLTFGRSADLIIDDNPFMHRVVGRFRNIDGVWRLENCSKRQLIEVRDEGGPSRLSVGPGRAASLLFGDFTCKFAAGPTSYEISGSPESFEWDADLLGGQGLASTVTVDWGHVELNDDQRKLLVVLCEQYLLAPNLRDAPLVTNRQAALRLGWPITKFNRKLDHLCDKLRRAGVHGLQGGLGGNALDRRRRLVDHALTVPLVSLDDLEQLN